ncbi:MAG: SCP2 domain-containing protein [Lautropia sp.]
MSRVPLPLAQLALSALNHALDQQPSLAEVLRAHAGRVLRIVVASPLPAALRRWSQVEADARIGDDGRLAVVTGAEPAATLTVTPSLDALAGLARDGAGGLGSNLRIEGDVMVAAALGQVARSLQWDYEEDLSRVVGDVAAHRVGSTLRALRAGAGAAGERWLDAVRRGVTAGDAPPLVAAAEFDAFTEQLRALAARIDALAPVHPADAAASGPAGPQRKARARRRP